MNAKLTKISSVLLCGMMLFASTGAVAGAASPAEEKKAETKAIATASAATSEAQEKQETVYVFTDAEGNQKNIIVSDWLKNGSASQTLRDQSILADVENIKGDETFEKDGENYTWNAQGNDIYYQGKTEKQPPISMKISYTLDGKAISPADLAGKSGHLVMRFDFENNEYATVNVNGTQKRVHVPFAVLTGMMLDGDVATNVQVSNGKVISDGDRTVVAGVALPGLAEDLQLDSGTLELPSYIEIKADVKNFHLTNTLTLATNQVFNELDEKEETGDLDELTSNLHQLEEAVDALVDGSSQLADGLETLLSKTDALSDGVGSLSSGLSKLSSKSNELNGGAKQVFLSLLNVANSQLSAAGVSAPKLTIQNYESVLNGIIDSMGEAAIRQKVEQGVRAQESVVKEGVTAAVQQQVESQVQAKAEQAVRDQVAQGLGMGFASWEEYENAVAQGQIPENVQTQVNAMVQQKINSEAFKATVQQQTQATMQSEAIQKTIAEKTEEQIQLLISQKLTEALQQAKSGAESISALKLQLDQYRVFYSGVLQYTAGVDQAAKGAKQLNGNMPALKEGIQALKDGADQLKDGMIAFDEQAIQKLVNALGDDLQGLLNGFEASMKAAKEYQCFAGAAQGTKGQTTFLYRTEAIEEKEKTE